MPQENNATPLVIGVDGGQSSTLTVLATVEGEVLGVAVTGPANHIHEPGGRERQYRTLRAGYEGAFKNAGLKPVRVQAAYLGITGSGDLEMATKAIPADTLVLQNDIVTAMAGAIPELHGVVIIAGTGSNAYGCSSVSGRSSRAGGWGYLAGDEGSGYDIACQALRAIYQASDGRGEPTHLTDLILQHFACHDLRQLHRRIYSGDLGRDALASAAAVVGAAAPEDAKAREILARAGRDLGTAVAAVLDSLGETDQAIPVAPIGGVFRAGNYVLEPMMGRIHETNPSAYLIKPRYAPAVGAVLLALRELGVQPSPLIHQNLERTYLVPDKA